MGQVRVVLRGTGAAPHVLHIRPKGAVSLIPVLLYGVTVRGFRPFEGFSGVSVVLRFSPFLILVHLLLPVLPVFGHTAPLSR